jgi:hypothetical protein
VTDDDDIAYVADEDDERGPGCLVVLAAVASAFGMAGCVGSVVWWVTIDKNVANAGPVGIMSGVYVMMVMGLSVVAGGFGLGVGIYSSIKAKLSPRPWLRPVASAAAFAGLAAVIGIILLVNVMIFGARLR